MPMNEMRAIATFAKAVELGSIRSAAVAQGVSPQAASQALAQLEQHLGVRLLHRTTRSLALTEEGMRLLVNREFVPALSTNDTELEIRAVLAGPAIGQLASFSVVATGSQEHGGKTGERRVISMGALRRGHRTSRRQ